MAVKGASIATLAAGGILVWSGLFNKTITQTIQDLVKGQKPKAGPTGGVPLVSSGQNLGQVGGTTGGGAISGSTATGQAIATDALAYQGTGYVWGGVPAKGINDKDCSSFANRVIGMDLHMAIPGFAGGSYRGQTHGPTTVTWLASVGSLTTRIPRKQMGAGDLAVWQTHMGIAINNSEMISAQNPENGTQVSPITGFIPGEILVCLRLKAALDARPPTGGRKK